MADSAASVEYGASGGEDNFIQLDIRQIPLTIGKSGKRSTTQYLAGMRGTVADLGEYQSGVASLKRLTLPSEFSFLQLLNTKPNVVRLSN